MTPDAELTVALPAVHAVAFDIAEYHRIVLRQPYRAFGPDGRGTQFFYLHAAGLRYFTPQMVL
jgi:hypothetical protein